MSEPDKELLADPESGNSKNYSIVFTRKTAAPQRLLVANETDSQTRLKSRDGEPIDFLFAIVTTKDEEGDIKLSNMCTAMKRAGVFFHTYDAKSGAPYRMTRIGATRSRLLSYANATDYRIGFDPTEIEKACQEINLVLENPEGEGDHWYPPYEHLFAPYESSHPHLYREFNEGDMLTNFQRLLSADTKFAGATKGCGFNFPELESGDKDNAFCLAVFVVHDEEERDALAAEWLPINWPWRLPVRRIASYFGEEMGFYFAFLGHLTSGMLPVAVVALVAQCVSWANAQRGGGAMHAESVFAVVAACAYSVVLDLWRFEQNRIAFLWEVYGCRKSLPSRPGFRGRVLKNPVSGKLTLGFPQTKRRPRERMSIAAILFMTSILVTTVVAIFIYRAILKRSNASQGELLIPSILNSIQITVFGAVYHQVAVFMTEYENHKTIAEHNSALFGKLTSFYFINYYASLFYIAFVQQQVEGCDDVLTGSSYCGRALAVQTAVVFIVNDFGNRMSNSVIVPQLTKRLKLYFSEKDEEVNVATMGPVEKQFVLMDTYDPQTSLVMDYIELFVQWGYLLLFGAACPIVAVFAFATNFIETRTDGHKLLYGHRRVVPNRVDGIGEPLNIFISLLHISIPVNGGLIVYSFGSLDAWVPAKYRVWVFMGFIAFMFAVLYVLNTIYPDMPQKTKIQLARQKIIYERVVKGVVEEDGEKLDLSPQDVGKKIADVKLEQKARYAEDVPQVSVEDVNDEDLEFFGVRRASTDMSPPRGSGRKI